MQKQRTAQHSNVDLDLNVNIMTRRDIRATLQHHPFSSSTNTTPFSLTELKHSEKTRSIPPAQTHIQHELLRKNTNPQKAGKREYTVSAVYFYHIVLFAVVWAPFIGELAVRW